MSPGLDQPLPPQQRLELCMEAQAGLFTALGSSGSFLAIPIAVVLGSSILIAAARRKSALGCEQFHY